MRDERGYLAAIEEIFLTVRGRGVQWTHADARQAAAWQAAGIDVATVADVVSARARAYRFLRGNTADLPPRLGYYARSIARRVGGPSAPAPTAPSATTRPAVRYDPLEHLLDEAIRLGERRDRWLGLYSRSAEALRGRLERPVDGGSATKQTNNPQAPASIDADQRWLDRHANELLEAALQGLESAEARALHGEALEQLSDRERAMRPRAQARRMKVHLRAGLGALGLSLPTWDGWRPAPDDAQAAHGTTERRHGR